MNNEKTLKHVKLLRATRLSTSSVAQPKKKKKKNSMDRDLIF